MFVAYGKDWVQLKYHGSILADLFSYELTRSITTAVSKHHFLNLESHSICSTLCHTNFVITNPNKRSVSKTVSYIFSS